MVFESSVVITYLFLQYVALCLPAVFVCTENVNVRVHDSLLQTKPKVTLTWTWSIFSIFIDEWHNFMQKNLYATHQQKYCNSVCLAIFAWDTSETVVCRYLHLPRISKLLQDIVDISHISPFLIAFYCLRCCCLTQLLSNCGEFPLIKHW